MTVRGKKIWNMVLILMAVFVGLVFLFPVFWMVRSSFMGLEELYANPPVFLPKNTTLQNYQAAMFQQIPFLRYLKNTLIIVFFSVVGALISNSLIAYGFSRFEFKGKNVWFMLIISTMMLPSAVTLIPQYQMWNRLHLLGTIAPLVVPAWFGGSAYFMFMLRQFFQTIPRELDEAAQDI